MPANRAIARARAVIVGLGLMIDHGAWLEEGRVLACAYPRHEEGLARLARQGVSVLINLHTRPHEPPYLARHGLAELHLPVADFTPPSPEQLAQGVAAIRRAVDAGEGVAVHCGAGLGRTGTLLACYLVDHGLTAEEALARVRAARPGSVETPAQAAAVEDFARSRQHDVARP